MMLGCERCVFVAVHGKYEVSSKSKNEEERVNFWESFKEMFE